MSCPRIRGKFLRAEYVVIKQGPATGRTVKKKGHEGAAEGQGFGHRDRDRAGVGKEDHREEIAHERDAEVQGGGSEVETLVAAGALEGEAAGRAGGVHLVELAGHEERLPAAVGAAVGQAPGEDGEAGDAHRRTEDGGRRTDERENQEDRGKTNWPHRAQKAQKSEAEFNH